jgi:pSer/pThr/pTyr-binding forkhead associated (FHA) protein
VNPPVEIKEKPSEKGDLSIRCSRCSTECSADSAFCKVCGFSLGNPGISGAIANGSPGQPAGWRSTPTAVHAAHGAQPAQAIQPSPPNPSEVLGQRITPEHKQEFKPAERHPRLIIVAKDGSEGPSFPLLSEQVDIGSQEGFVLLKEDPYISPRHARLLLEQGQWHVQDLATVNGVYLKLRKQVPLHDGDLILLGQQVLRFELVMDAEQGLGPAIQHGTSVFGTPQTARYARLAQRTVEGVTRDVFYIHRSETTLGREHADIVFTDDPFLSRRHAILHRNQQTGRFSLEDLGSSNGTFHLLRTKTALVNGDVLRLGMHMLQLNLESGTLPPRTTQTKGTHE